MRVLVEIARDTGGVKRLSGLDREILVLDDLVGRFGSSSETSNAGRSISAS